MDDHVRQPARGRVRPEAEPVAERPAKLHASVLSPTDDLLAVTVSDGTRFSSFERGGELCLEGGSCPENVTRLLGVPWAARTW